MIVYEKRRFLFLFSLLLFLNKLNSLFNKCIAYTNIEHTYSTKRMYT